jgi:hypothetical protein
MRGSILQPTRFERAAGMGCCRAEFDEPRQPLPYRPGSIAWIALLALALFIGFCTGAVVPLP